MGFFSDGKQNLLDRGFKHAAMTHGSLPRSDYRIESLRHMPIQGPSPLNSRHRRDHHGHLHHRARHHRDDLAGPDPVSADPLQS